MRINLYIIMLCEFGHGVFHTTKQNTDRRLKLHRYFCLLLISSYFANVKCGAVVLWCCAAVGDIYMNRAPEHHAVILFLSVRVWSDDLPSTISQSTRKYYSFDDKLGTTMPTYFRLAIHTKKKKKKGPNCKDKQFEAHLLFHQLHST